MAGETTKSTQVTNQEASPQVFLRPEEFAGRVRTIMGTYEFTATMTQAADVFHMARVPADAVIRKLELAWDDLDTNATETLAIDVGVYATDGTAKDADVYYNCGTDATFEDTAAFDDFAFKTRDIADILNRVFEDAGDTEASHDAEYYLSLTIQDAAATAPGGTVSWRIEYVID